MEEKPVLKTIPLRQIKGKPIYSTHREHMMMFSAVCFAALWMYVGRLAQSSQMFTNFRGLIFPREALLIVGGLVYLLIKRNNFRFLMEDGVYFVRKGAATHVPWELIKSAKVVHGATWSYLQVDVDAEPSSVYIPESEKERRFRHSPEVVKCFSQHVHVSGLDKK